MHRCGKTMWCDTETADGDEGLALGVHLGMGGRIVVTDGHGMRIGGGPPGAGGLRSRRGGYEIGPDRQLRKARGRQQAKPTGRERQSGTASR